MYTEIITWYRENKRDLIFRQYSDPYAIWVSEIMAQQTKIDTMLPYFKKWMKRFPTISACSLASEEEILMAWEGLGYYRRAKLLHQGCKFVVNHFSGVFPKTYESILSIPGIGEYTAAAIFSIVYNGKKPAVDGNVVRIVTRVCEIGADSTSIRTKRDITEIVHSWMDECSLCNFSDFTQGLMEIGALVCTPKKPKCDSCPLNQHCLSFANKTQASFPVRPRKKASPTESYDVFLIINNNKILVSKDWSDGLMNGLFRLPQVERNMRDNILVKKELGKSTHVFSHKKWSLTILEASVADETLIPDVWSWMNISKLKNYPFVTAHKEIIKKYIAPLLNNK